jgi:mannose-6-phosphate isomerase
MNEQGSKVFPLKNSVRNYAWGSYDGLARFAGIEQERDKPIAEYWMGSHPGLPSQVVYKNGQSQSLETLIRDYPTKMLGDEIFSEYGDLPFLFKVLSASMPLSIQVHPGRRNAELGYERENDLGISKAAPERNYRDKNHKPELAVALSPFTALCGFRQAQDIAGLLGPELGAFFSFYPENRDASIRYLLEKSLSLREKDRIHLESLALSRARELLDSGIHTEKLAGQTLKLCYDHYPHDPGAISPLFMMVHELDPGEGLFVPAGVMHAYLSGTILEIMATSDNVIRGGLTHKHIDIQELLGILDFTAEPIRIHPVKKTSGVETIVWPTPAREFLLESTRLDEDSSHSFNVTGPEILLCTEGSLLLRETMKSEPISLGRGCSLFVSAACETYVVMGKGLLYRARTGQKTGRYE